MSAMNERKRPARRARLLNVLMVAAVVVSSFAFVSASQPGRAVAANPCDPPVVNKIACENTKAGTSDWQVAYRDETIGGFTTDISYQAGDRVDFKVKTDASSYRIDIFRLGYYGGDGARQLGSVTRSTPQSQPPCLRDDPTGHIDCGNWAVSAGWTVPADAVSGIYYARLRRGDNGYENEVIFVVRDDTSTSEIFFQTSDSTWAAYNRYGGNSLYWGDGPGQGGSAFKVSYNRPVLSGDGEENHIFNAEYPMLRFLEANGYDLSYTTDVDSARRGHLIKNHKVFMPVGHDEYWSNEQRDAVEAARQAGVHLAFLTANEIFWKTRWEPSIDSSATDWRTVVTYKETKPTQVDPSPEWTGTWRDPRYSPPKDGGRPENALLGNIFTVNGRRDDSLKVPAEYGKMRLWRNTPLASMSAGTTYTFQPGTLGYEWNSVEDNGFQPPGVAQLSRTTVAMTEGNYVLKNHGDEYGTGTKTHAATLYRHPSGPLVFGAGTVQWAWGVDNEHAYQTTTPTADVRMQQATVNLLADMDAQPATLRPGLVKATKSMDITAPAVAITDVPTASTVGESYTFSGTVVDVGGVVGGVEVSTDGGKRWHPANWKAGETSWSHTYIPPKSGPASLLVRAVDDSANLSTPVSASPTVSPRTCPCGIWTEAATPQKPDTVDGVPLELGVKWRSSSDGYVRGVKFYKGARNTGTHTGSLWNMAGERLAHGTFSNETATGWQTLTFPKPVAVQADTTYVVSYYSPNGGYGYDIEYFSRKSEFLEPLTALQAGTDVPNGVYRAGSSGFPTKTSWDSNYWVDVVWAPDPGPDIRPPELTSTDPVDGAGTVSLTPRISATFDEPVEPSSVQFTLSSASGPAAGTSSVSSDRTVVSFTPDAPLTETTAYTASLQLSDTAGNALSDPVTWKFTTGSARSAGCPCTVWDDFTEPQVASVQDSSAVELGTKVRFDGKGEVIGVRFYKGSKNTGTHTGSLWSASGERLATGTFSGETTTGWQTLTFASPVAVKSNTTYIVSYYAPDGGYSVDGGYFSDEASYGPIRALRSGADGGNGVYRYGTGGGFPTASYNASNYWVDVIFRNGLNGDTTPPSLTGHAPEVDATAVSLNTALTATFSEPMDPESARIWLTDPGGAKLTGSVAISADEKTLTWTPAGRLAPGTRYTASVSVADVNGNAMPDPATWAFTTGAAQTCPCSLFSTATVPTMTSSDTGSYELGVRFVPKSSGKITGVRFYKSAGNTGTHTGSLWSASGERLATGTFTGGTGSGWQTLTFDTPVTVWADATYTASYTTSSGYSFDSGYFSGYSVSSLPLTAPDSPNGVYQVGSGYPTLTYGGANYWVDAVFEPSSDSTPPTLTSRTPDADATGVALESTVSATFSEPVDLSGAQFSVTDPGGAKLTGTLARSADGTTLTWTPGADFAPGTRYTASVRAGDPEGNAMPGAQSWSFTTTMSTTCPCSLFSAATLPTVASADDGGSYELGVRFSPEVDGKVTGVKFYKGSKNTGTHTGSLWSASGERLTTGTFTGESASGWQTLTFDTPVTVTAGATYVASYTTTAGGYSVDGGYFSTAVTSPPLTAPASGAGSPNGVYQAGSGFPSSTYGASNYWVDVMFAKG